MGQTPLETASRGPHSLTSTESRENYVVLSIYKYRFCDIGTCVPAILTVVTGGLCSKCAHRCTHTTAMPTSAFFQSLHKYIHTHMYVCMPTTDALLCNAVEAPWNGIKYKPTYVRKYACYCVSVQMMYSTRTLATMLRVYVLWL